MIETLISSKTRIKLLLKFFLNSNNRTYLRGLAHEFDESTNAIRVELNRFEEAGMLYSEHEGNKKYFSANIKHPLFKEIHNIVRKYVGIDHIVEHIIKHMGNVKKVYLVGKFSQGLDSEIIDLVFVGEINKGYLLELIEKAEPLIERKIRFVCYDSEEFTQEKLALYNPTPLLLYSNDKDKRETKTDNF